MEDLIHIGGSVPAILEKAPDVERGPGLILIEEIWGLTPHIADVAKRFAKEGYAVVAPELLADTGVLEKISPETFALMRSEDEATRTAAQAQMREATAPIYTQEFAHSALAKLKTCHEQLGKISNGKIAVVGFCFGGTYAFHLAAHEPGLKACVPFYGRAPSEEEVKEIACPVLAFYGEEDRALMESLPKLKKNMAAAGKNFEAVIYPGTGHAFFNDTNAVAYREEPAKDAWQKTLAFLRENV